MDRMSKSKRSSIMRAIRSKNTGPEIKLRKELFSRGFRYRIHYGNEKIDIAFPSSKVAVFIDGCFWHKCRMHYTRPSSNIRFWHDKIHKNVIRDRKKSNLLKKDGWKILRFWEHEINENAEKCINRIAREIDKNRLRQ